jgi:aspartyl-tRNA(Asn)/glutamyl-tRNA(Gln) amidotransferase subunit A
MKALHSLTVTEALKLLESGEITSLQLVNACIDRIHEMEPEIFAFITTIEDEAREKAKIIDEKRKNGEKVGKLAGIPFSMKDVYNVKGYPTTAGSNVLKGYISVYNATVYEKLAAEDAILIGKTNCDPFGFGSSTENSAYGATRNPINTDYVPGGSSGGSGAAVAYGGGLFSIAEDTGGSIRCPASFCGVVGLKPTYGRVSRYGAIAYASSHDTVGPIAKSVEDTALITQIIAGKDRRDATSGDVEVPNYVEFLAQPLKGKKIGLPKEYFGEGLHPEVREHIQKAVEKFKSLGCEIVDISLPLTEYAIAAYYVVGISEASSNLARYDGIRYGLEKEATEWKTQIKKTRGEGFGAEEKRRVMIGTYSLSAGYADEYYKQAMKVRQLLKESVLKAFEQVDVILTPTMPDLPFKFGDNSEDPLKMWLADAFTVTVNPVGVPAMSVPVGNSKQGLPIGMQLIAPHFKEEVLFNFGYQFENA